MESIFKDLNIQLADRKNKGPKVTLLIINNPDGTPRWICNAASKAPLFLKFYLVRSFTSQCIALAIRTIFFLGLQKRVFKTKEVSYNTLENNAEPVIAIDQDNWAIFTGTVGPNNKLLVYESSEDGGAFHKVANSEKALTLIENEKSVIQELESMNPITFTFPKFNRIQHNIIKLDDISSNGKRTSKFTHVHRSVLGELYSKTITSGEASSLPIFNQSLLRLGQLEKCNDKRIPKGIVKKLRKMMETMQHKTIDVALCHGDFTPWNMYMKNEKLALYDWELSNPSMPIGHDAFHYIIQQGILVDKKPWKAIKKELKGSINSKQFLEWSLNKQNNIEEYLGYYLTINTIACLALFTSQYKWHPQVHWMLNTWNDALSDCMKEKESQRGLLITDVFDFLNEKKYAAIKFPDIAPEKLSEFSDIDMCMEKKDLKAFVKYLKNHSLTAQTHVQRKSFMMTIQIFMKDGGFLSLDVIWKFKRKSLVMLNAEDVLNNVYRNTYQIKQMGLLDKVRYIGLFYGLNNSSIPTKYKVYQQILANGESRLDEILYCNYLDNSTLKRNLIQCLKKMKENQFLNRMGNMLDYCWDSAKQLLFARGMVITFSGVDGAGKSTVIESIKDKIEKKIRKRVIVLRHRPSILPILSVWTKGREKAKQDVLDSLPRKGQNNSYLGSFFRFIYYYADYVFGQFYIYFKYVCKGYVVLYDRYYFDFINDGKRSNIKLPKGLVKAGYRLLMKPDLNFFLHANAKTILGRKQELDEYAIGALTDAYLRLFKELKTTSDRQYFTIENNELDRTLVYVMKETTQKLAHIS